MFCGCSLVYGVHTLVCRERTEELKKRMKEIEEDLKNPKPLKITRQEIDFKKIIVP